VDLCFASVVAGMKFTAVFVAVAALCAIAFADEVPAALMPCSFRLTAHISIYDADGTEIASTVNEIMRDNGEYWAWKSEGHGDEFVQAVLPDHEWSIIWRQDLGLSFRHDIKTQSCTESSDTPTPFKWIENKTYGLMWFDELVDYEGKEATLYTAVAAGSRSGYDFEAVANFFVINADNTLVFINGTATALHQGIEVSFKSTRLYFEHNDPIDPRMFAIQAPCNLHGSPQGPSDAFKEACYHTSAAVSTAASWLALLVALFAMLLNF